MRRAVLIAVGLWATGAGAQEVASPRWEVSGAFGPRWVLGNGTLLPTLTLGGARRVVRQESWSLWVELSASGWLSSNSSVTDGLTTANSLKAADAVVVGRAELPLGSRWLLYAAVGAGGGASGLASATTFAGGETTVHDFAVLQGTLGARWNVTPRLFLQIEPLGVMLYAASAGSSWLYSLQAGPGWRL